MISENTTNISFKEFQYKLQDSDVQNCFFMNETKDKKLVDVDVYNEIFRLRNNTTEKSNFIDRVKRECQNNIWYYFREVVRIPTEFNITTGIDTGLARFPLTDNVAKLIYLYEKGHSVLVKIDGQSKKGTKELFDMTFMLFALYEEFFSDPDSKSYVELTPPCSSWHDKLQQYLWAMNSVIGSIYGVSSKHSSICRPLKIFNSKNKLTSPYDNPGKIRYPKIIYPSIETDVELKDFLNEADFRERSKTVGMISVKDQRFIPSFDIVKRYILDLRYDHDSYYIYDDTDIPMNAIYKL